MNDSGVWGLYLETWLLLLSVVLVAVLLWARCGRALPGPWLGLRRTADVGQSCSGNCAVNWPLTLVSVPLSHGVTVIRSLTLISLFIASIVTVPHRLLSSTCFSLPYVIWPQLSLSLTCALSHAHAQPHSSFLSCSADTAHTSSSSLSLSWHFASLLPSAYFEAFLLDLI